MFRKMRGVRVAADKQGLLFFLCRNYRWLPEEMRGKIDKLCAEVSGGDPTYRSALFDTLTTHDSITAICIRHPVGKTKLYELRRMFYEAWYKKEAGD